MRELTSIEEVKDLPCIVGQDLRVGGSIRAGVGALVCDVFAEGAGAGNRRRDTGAGLALEVLLIGGGASGALLHLEIYIFESF